MSYCKIAYDRRYDVVLWLIPFTIWCVDTSCFLGECTKDERRKESFESVSNNHLSLNEFWLYHHAQWLHDSNEIPDSLNACWANLQLLTSVKYEQDGIQQDGPPRIIPWIPGTVWKGPRPNPDYLKSPFLKSSYIFIGNLKDK